MLYNSNEIQQIIPHRYPFLLVDCIESISAVSYTHLTLPTNSLV